MMRFVFAALGLFLTAPAGAQTPPDWMAGAWLSCAEGAEVAEVWTGAGSGVLVGANVTRARRTSFEHLRVAPNAAGGLSYFSLPNGRSPATEFPLVSHEGQRAVFENPAHDFPQRIIYARTGDTLVARIEGTDGETASHAEWRFRRAYLGERCAPGAPAQRAAGEGD